MAAATDIIHDEDVLDAVLESLGGVAATVSTRYPAGLAGSLPEVWRTGTHGVLRLKLLEFGQPDLPALVASKLEEHPDLSPEDALRTKLMPALFCAWGESSHNLGTSALGHGGTGVGGTHGWSVPLQLIHMRWWDRDPARTQCLATTDKLGAATIAGPAGAMNQHRAQRHYAKIVSKALAGAGGKLGSPTLTTTDTGASVIVVEYHKVNYDLNTGHPNLVAFSVDFTVQVRTK